MANLTTTEKYALAQILVCGAITKEEFKSMNSFLGEVQDRTIVNLQQENILSKHTLMR